MSIPTRVDEELYEAAKASGAINSRSAAQQIAHWANVGRSVERSGHVSQQEIEQVLAGEKSYKDLNAYAQQVVRKEWDRQIDEGISGLDFAEEFETAGESWSEANEEGAVIVRHCAKSPDSSAT